MKKGLKYYAPCWAIALIVFNVITFAVPATVNVNKFTSSFWIGYAFISLMFIAQLACSILFFKQGNNNKIFLNVPVIRLSYIALIVSIIVGAVAMIIPFIPYWVGIIVDVLVATFYAVAIISSKAAADTIESIDDKIKAQTFFIRSLTADAESLVSRAKSDDARAMAKKVYEALRYSDPMSNDALVNVDAEIENVFFAFSKNINSGENCTELADELVNLIGDRNRKCKLLK